MSYEDPTHAYQDWLDNIDTVALFEMGLLHTAPEYCPNCEIEQVVYDEPIEGSDDLLRTCDYCEHQWRISEE